MAKRKSFLLAVLLLCFSLLLTACYSITLKEKQVAGINSTISLKLPGNLQNLSFSVPLDPLSQRYFQGSRLYGEMDGGLYVAIYTNAIDTQQMYADLHLTEGETLSQRINQTAESASKAVLEKVKAENVQIQQGTTTVSGQHAVSQTFTFTYKEKKMQANLVGFATGADTWIVVVACDANKADKVKLADEVLASLKIIS